MSDTIASLRARIKQLEAMLKCKHCGHLRGEHDDDNMPCFGGRDASMGPDEGEYCDCFGFEPESVK